MAAKRILRYLKGTKQHELVFRMCEGGVSVCAFSDADWAVRWHRERVQVAYE